MFIFQLQNNKAVAASSCTCCPHTLAGFSGWIGVLSTRQVAVDFLAHTGGVVSRRSFRGSDIEKRSYMESQARGRQGCVGHFDVWTQSGKPPHVSLSLKDIFLF